MIKRTYVCKFTIRETDKKGTQKVINHRYGTITSYSWFSQSDDIYKILSDEAKEMFPGKIIELNFFKRVK